EAAARWDELTGLANRATFDAALEKRIASGRSAAVVFCDLDRFKRINDTSGHAAGDAVLVEVARRMGEAVGDDDLLARFGGDEFTVLLRPGVDADDAQRLARQIQRSVEGSYRVAADHGPGLGLSITAGLAFGGSGRDATEVMRNADLALYAAKSEARGSLRVFEQSMYDDFARRVMLEQRLRVALDNDGLTLAYQPLLDLESGAVVGVEALLRWFDDGEVVLAPPELIELAESFDSDGQVGRWVLRSAVAQAAAWSAASYPVRVSINVTTRQLLDPDLVDVVKGLLAEHDLDASLVTLEITEGAFLDDASKAIEHLHKLRDIGIGLAIDDFGTGYSSLAYLTRLPVGELKVDRAFVAGLPHDKDRTALVRTVIRLANDLGFMVTGEGVERMDQLRLLRGMGAHLAQGYLISHPLPADKLLDLLKQGPFVVDVADGESELRHTSSGMPHRVVD
ncbi:MAG: bifunctional diguanylate cyclase/phosphodiesterase, partial [Aquihabitans sp.]